MKNRLYLSMFLGFLICLASSCASKPPCLIAPPHDYHGNKEAAQKVAADLTKLTKMPLDANLESSFKNEIEVSYQDIPDKDVRCQMFLQAIACLSERKDTGADLLASKLMDCLVQEHVCTGDKVEPLKMKLQESALSSGSSEHAPGKIGPLEVSASRNGSVHAQSKPSSSSLSPVVIPHKGQVTVSVVDGKGNPQRMEEVYVSCAKGEANVKTNGANHITVPINNCNQLSVNCQLRPNSRWLADVWHYENRGGFLVLSEYRIIVNGVSLNSSTVKREGDNANYVAKLIRK